MGAAWGGGGGGGGPVRCCWTGVLEENREAKSIFGLVAGVVLVLESLGDSAASRSVEEVCG